MAVLKILKYGDEALKKKCLAVDEITPEIKKLVKDMLETMYKAPGVGLAAPQVGVLKRVCVIDVYHDEEASHIVLINPKIIEKKGKKTYMEEGCLSFPGITKKVKRWNTLKVTAVDERGMPIIIEGNGLLSRALQHEIDHLDGIVFIKRLGLMSRLKTEREIRKRKREGSW